MILGVSYPDKTCQLGCGEMDTLQNILKQKHMSKDMSTSEMEYEDNILILHLYFHFFFPVFSLFMFPYYTIRPLILEICQMLSPPDPSPSYTLTFPMSRQVSQSSLYPTLFELQGNFRNFLIHK